jgi:hypothetical protein
LTSVTIKPEALSKAWEELVEGIRRGSKKARILLVDPYCHGALLRSYSETANTSGVSERMETDVMGAVQERISTNGVNRGRGLLEIDDAVRRLRGTVKLAQDSGGAYRLVFEFPVPRS